MAVRLTVAHAAKPEFNALRPNGQTCVPDSLLYGPDPFQGGQVMSDQQPIQTDHASPSRRRFIKVAGAGVAGASLLTMLDARQAPAQIKGSTLRILTWSHFIPAYDVWFDKFSGEWGEKNGVKVRVDHIPHLESPARMAAEFAAGAGHDIILNNSTILARLYYKSLLDLTDVYDGLGKKHGGWVTAAKAPHRGGERGFRIP